VFGVAGVKPRDNGIAVAPDLPPTWTRLSFPLQWRGRQVRLRFETDPPEIVVAVETGGELTVEVPGAQVLRISAGQCMAVRDNGSGWGAWQKVHQ